MSATWEGRTARFGIVSRTHVVLHPNVEPERDEWSQYVEDLRIALPKIDGVLVFTHGGGPTALQRKELTAMYRANPPQPPISVVTPSVFVRGIVTALNWFAEEIRTCAPDQLSAAFNHLATPEAARQEIMAKIAEHRAWLESGADSRLWR